MTTVSIQKTDDIKYPDGPRGMKCDQEYGIFLDGLLRARIAKGHRKWFIVAENTGNILGHAPNLKRARELAMTLHYV